MRVIRTDPKQNEIVDVRRKLGNENYGVWSIEKTSFHESQKQMDNQALEQLMTEARLLGVDPIQVFRVGLKAHQRRLSPAFPVYQALTNNGSSPFLLYLSPSLFIELETPKGDLGRQRAEVVQEALLHGGYRFHVDPEKEDFDIEYYDLCGHRVDDVALPMDDTELARRGIGYGLVASRVYHRFIVDDSDAKLFNDLLRLAELRGREFPFHAEDGVSL